ncbi:hypothetical protein PLICRDRAFT_97380 [Plicaturopsis crispa FD-325 SS-3]|nr:hypothetical protein PLICRDRAFT_97380 [Plicaturopsis crispa FD-325 SS-3]
MPIYQPIHPDVRPRLDPEYVAFHEQHLQYIQPSQTLPWDPSAREAAPMPGGSEPLKVGSIRDIQLDHCRLRVFTPESMRPAPGWPVCIWFHGGGWTLGGLGSENSLCTVLCNRASCVVATVDYRLAPEHPYPAAVEDAVEALRWIFTKGEAELEADTSRIAVAGSSAGGNLAAILSLKAATLSPPIPLIFQLLCIPVIDNTATAATVWSPNRNAPWLTPDRMTWYRRMYLPDERDWGKWDASPTFAPRALIAQSPRTWIGVAELDILKPEGVAYGEQLREAGVETEIRIYEGSTHSHQEKGGSLIP